MTRIGTVRRHKRFLNNNKFGDNMKRKEKLSHSTMVKISRALDDIQHDRVYNEKEWIEIREKMFGG